MAFSIPGPKIARSLLWASGMAFPIPGGHQDGVRGYPRYGFSHTGPEVQLRPHRYGLSHTGSRNGTTNQGGGGGKK